MAWWRKRRSTPDPTRPGSADGGEVPEQPLERVAVLGETPPTEVIGTTSTGDVLAFRAPAGDLVAWWQQLRAEHPRTGLWPVLLGPEVGDLCAALPGGARDDYDPAAELARAERMTIDDLRALRVRRTERYGDLGGDDSFGDDEDDDDALAMVEPPRLANHPATFTVAKADGLVALVPAAHGWQVPVLLGWDGGVNYDMEPVDHAVVLRDWQERFGAELVTLDGEQVLELWVDRPPASTAEALAVAREQYEYCYDVVHQGVGSLTDLAGDQVGSRSWYFWWD
ncbi:DUF4253 domain-containing protein [Cellulomonas fimi]|uniref:DUF4253 domain-containing protein n=1 Tax=Cellulomonas fimi TaxID=1708 RepID=UPI00234C0E53|nr:DUF4253 domain-containing protein [Cellulomonas fimi]MDC7121673.1 DUF4253 domain-containing protein [Cellulomonas fimi]